MDSILNSPKLFEQNHSEGFSLLLKARPIWRTSHRINRLSKSISDAGWSSLIAMIVYKAEMNDKTVVKIDRYYPSSKTCSVCGWKNDALTLADRGWTMD